MDPLGDIFPALNAGASLPQHCVSHVTSSRLWSAAHASPINGPLLWRFVLTNVGRRKPFTLVEGSVTFANQFAILTLFPSLLCARNSTSISWPIMCSPYLECRRMSHISRDPFVLIICPSSHKHLMRAARRRLSRSFKGSIPPNTHFWDFAGFCCICSQK